MLLIINSDQYIGYCIASHLAKYNTLRSKLRLTCANKSYCYGFSNAGIDVRQLDYNHPHQVSQTLRGVDQMILVIGHESNRVENAKHLCQAAAQSGVRSIVCISHVGANSKTHPSLQEYHQIENQVINSGCQYTILRLDFLQQYFHLWSNHAEKTRQMILPFNETVEFCPIDITDVCKVIEKICLDQNNLKPLDDEHDGQVYTLAGPEKLSSKNFVDCLIQATGYQHFKFVQCRPMDLNYYLSRLCKDVWFDARIKHEMAQIYHDDYKTNNYKTKVYSNPTDKQINTFIEYFDWVKNSSGSLSVSHLNMLTNSKGTSIQEFFTENANSFKPRV